MLASPATPPRSPTTVRCFDRNRTADSTPMRGTVNCQLALLLLLWVSSTVVTGCLVALEMDRSCRRRGCGRPEGRPYNTTGSDSVGAMLASPATPPRSPTTVRSQRHQGEDR